MYLNNYQIIGRIGQDPKPNITNGKTVCNFSVAVQSPSDKDKSKTLWIKVVVWEKLADSCIKYLSKGKAVYIEGRLQERTWEKEGVTQRVIELIAHNVQFLSPKEESDKKVEQVFDPEIDKYVDIPF